MVVLYISIIMIMRVVQSVLGKKTADFLPRNASAYLKYNSYYQAIAGVIACVVMVVAILCGSKVPQLGNTILYASISGIALGVSCILSIYLLCITSMALASIFATAGLLVPTVASIFLYDEAMMWYQWIAVVIFIIGSYLMIGNAKKIYNKFTLKTLLLLILHFAVNGITMLMQKIFGMQVDGGNTSLFSFATFASGAAVAIAGLGVLSIVTQSIKKKSPVKQSVQAQCNEAIEERFRFIVTDKTTTRLPRVIYIYGAALAVAVFLINQFATMSTPLISSVVLFTLINGGATVISALVGAIVFREKLSISGIVGLVLGIGALILVQI